MAEKQKKTKPISKSARSCQRLLALKNWSLAADRGGSYHKCVFFTPIFISVLCNSKLKTLITRLKILWKACKWPKYMFINIIWLIKNKKNKNFMFSIFSKDSTWTMAKFLISTPLFREFPLWTCVIRRVGLSADNENAVEPRIASHGPAVSKSELCSNL